jgi:hypothetical protein
MNVELIRSTVEVNHEGITYIDKGNMRIITLEPLVYNKYCIFHVEGAKCGEL